MKDRSEERADLNGYQRPGKVAAKTWTLINWMRKLRRKEAMWSGGRNGPLLVRLIKRPLQKEELVFSVESVVSGDEN
jgi:hypothetical protein